MYPVPGTIRDENHLGEVLAQPYSETVDLMRRLDGDLMVLGVGGKMGPSLARLAVRACREAGVSKAVTGVARFSEPGLREALERDGVRTVACDLSDADAVARLPRVRNVIFMAGRKFGLTGSEAQTWIMNVVVPANVARVFAGSRIVAFSTGCVYPLVAPGMPGCTEGVPPAPVGEYANSCLGRERVFEHFSRETNTPVLLYRLNYAIDMKYGVLADVAGRILRGQPVDLTVGSANVIWQGDANNRALLCLEHASVPAVPLNITGPETVTIRDLAAEFGRLLGRPVMFTGSDSGKAYLSDASRSTALFGPPRISVPVLVRWTADWLGRGGATLGKPTHFAVTDGQFLDEPSTGAGS